jgi:hypothetical protein
MTAFRGTLDQIGLPSILSLVDMERKTGMLVLILEPGKEKARIQFIDGRVVRAAYDKKDRPKNAELIYELLGRTEGKFEFRNVMIDSRTRSTAPPPISSSKAPASSTKPAIAAGTTNRSILYQFVTKPPLLLLFMGLSGDEN